MDKNKKEILFTILQPISAAGLSDRIHALNTLYCLGKACSFTYVHTPFDCPRSYPHNSILSAVEKTTSIPLKSILSRRIVRFLGIEKFDINIGEKKHFTTINVNLDKIFSENNFSSILELKSHIESLHYKNSQVILALTWTYKMYEIVDRVYPLLACQDLDPLRRVPSLRLSEKYWKARKQHPISVAFDDLKVKIVIHIRKGDTVPIILGDGTVLFEGHQQEYYNSGSVKNYINFLEKLFDRYDHNFFSVIVVSDGYSAAFREVRSRIRKRQLKLSREQKRELSQLRQQYDGEFNYFSRFENVTIIIDKNECDLFKSIHAIICADILVYSGGGFSRQIHENFRDKDCDSVLISLKQDTEHSIEQIGDILKKFPIYNN